MEGDVNSASKRMSNDVAIVEARLTQCPGSQQRYTETDR